MTSPRACLLGFFTAQGSHIVAGFSSVSKAEAVGLLERRLISESIYLCHTPLVKDSRKAGLDSRAGERDAAFGERSSMCVQAGKDSIKAIFLYFLPQNALSPE